MYLRINALVPRLKPQQEENGPGDFSIDLKQKQVHITEEGHEHVERLMLEGGLLGLLGVAAGLILGSLIAWILVAIVNPQSFHWTMSLHMPWGQLATAGLALIATACVTALASAKRAMSASAVRAVREDW